jgi:hypothetical protein
MSLHPLLDLLLAEIKINVVMTAVYIANLAPKLKRNVVKDNYNKVKEFLM